MKMISKLFLAVIGAAALFAVPANAATFTGNFNDPLFLGNLAATSTTGSVDQGVTGDTADRRSPWTTTTHPNEIYTAVLAGGTATYDLGSPLTAISFLWGSVDDFNRIQFFSGAVLVDTLTGEDVLDENVGVIEGDGYFNILITAASFDRMVFDSGNTNSFEFSNLVVTAVPLPAALPLYGAGIAVLGFIGWRKRSRATASA